MEVVLPPEGIDYDELERAILSAALGASGGNVAQAARLLKMSRDTLRYRVRKFGLVAHPDDG